jgi:hypothetical protein
MKTKIEIKSIYGSILYSYESENNTLRNTVKEAIRNSADLSSADLRSADLRYADLRYADLRYADLSSANLRSADLSSADLSSADLSSADLSYADLSYADLSYADLRSAKHNETTGFLLLQCPQEGSFIGWKKAQGNIIKLRITELAKRSSATTLKCRCSEAEVLDIQDIEGNSLEIREIASDKDCDFLYKVGEIVKVDDFDENRWNECSSGIHFFIAREMAVQYGL